MPLAGAGTSEGEPSNWAIDYTIKGDDKQYRYRIPFRAKPEIEPISTVIIHDADWQYDSSRTQHVWGIRIEVRQGVNSPFWGFIELDDYGYPVDAHYVRRTFFDKELKQRLTPWYRWSLRLRNHEFESRHDAYSGKPGSMRDSDELSQIFHDILESTESAEVRRQVIYMILEADAMCDDTVPLVEKCLDSPDEEEAKDAKYILKLHAGEKAHRD